MNQEAPPTSRPPPTTLPRVTGTRLANSPIRPGDGVDAGLADGRQRHASGMKYMSATESSKPAVTKAAIEQDGQKLVAGAAGAHREPDRQTDQVAKMSGQNA